MIFKLNITSSPWTVNNSITSSQCTKVMPGLILELPASEVISTIDVFWCSSIKFYMESNFSSSLAAIFQKIWRWKTWSLQRACMRGRRAVLYLLSTLLQEAQRKLLQLLIGTLPPFLVINVTLYLWWLWVGSVVLSASPYFVPLLCIFFIDTDQVLVVQVVLLLLISRSLGYKWCLDFLIISVGCQRCFFCRSELFKRTTLFELS